VSVTLRGHNVVGGSGVGERIEVNELNGLVANEFAKAGDEPRMADAIEIDRTNSV